MKKIGLALGSGGARGIAHIAFLKVFDELNIKPSVISGSSMGAMIGALYASGYSGAEIERIFTSLSIRQVRSLFDISIRRSKGLLKGTKLMNFFCKTMKCGTFEELEIPLKIVATDFLKREQFVFDGGSISDAVRASISIPGVFAPHEINGRIFVDGGIVNPVPFDIIRNECDLLVAIDVTDDWNKKQDYSRARAINFVSDSTVILMKTITLQRMCTAKPDIYVNPLIGSVKTYDFIHAKMILASVEKDAALFKKNLKAALE